MPLTSKGVKIKAAMDKEYGDKKGEQVFYASLASGKITGAHKGKKVRVKKDSESKRESKAKNEEKD